MPAELEDQGPTYRCGVYAAKQWFDGNGYPTDGIPALPRYFALADGQKGLSFSQENALLSEFATQTKAPIEFLGDGYLHDFATFDQAVRDGWCVIVGVWEADLIAGQSYYHFIDITGLNGTTFTIVDSFHKYDGEDGSAPLVDVHKAIQDNWDADIIGLAFKFTQPPAPVLSKEAQLVNLLSVIGDKSYLTPPDTASIQELVQTAKKLLGA